MKISSFYKKVVAVSSLLAVPLMTFAQFTNDFDTSGGAKDLRGLIGLIIGYLNLVLVLLMALAVVAFVFYVIKYFILPNEDRKQAGSYVMYSVIGFFVILSFWGLVNILQNTFRLENRGNNWQNNVRDIFPTGRP